MKIAEILTNKNGDNISAQSDKNILYETSDEDMQIWHTAERIFDEIKQRYKEQKTIAPFFKELNYWEKLGDINEFTSSDIFSKNLSIIIGSFQILGYLFNGRKVSGGFNPNWDAIILNPELLYVNNYKLLLSTIAHELRHSLDEKKIENKDIEKYHFGRYFN